MYKKPMIVVFVFVFLSLGLSGCMEQSTNIDERFLGLWTEIDPNIPQGTDYYHRVTFYNNGTLNDTFWYEGYDADEPVTNWYNYKINGNTLCLTQLNIKEDYSTCYNFKFSLDEKKLNLTSANQPQYIVLLEKVVN